MSALLQGNGDPIEFTDGLLKPLHFSDGLPYEQNGTIAADTVSPIDHYHQGLPFTEVGRLCVSSSDPVRFEGGAAPITADGRLSMAIEAFGKRFNSGVPYTTFGKIAGLRSISVGRAFSSAFSTGFF